MQVSKKGLLVMHPSKFDHLHNHVQNTGIDSEWNLKMACSFPDFPDQHRHYRNFPTKERRHS